MKNILYLVQVLIIGSLGLSMPAFAASSGTTPSAGHDIVLVDYQARHPSYYYHNKKPKYYRGAPPARYYRNTPRRHYYNTPPQHRKSYPYRYERDASPRYHR